MIDSKGGRIEDRRKKEKGGGKPLEAYIYDRDRRTREEE